jgi:hypothetical protein
MPAELHSSYQSLFIMSKTFSGEFLTGARSHRTYGNEEGFLLEHAFTLIFPAFCLFDPLQAR